MFRSAAERLVAIGDLHGDLAKAREAFRAGGLTDADGRWIGGRTVAVQVGDQLDRGGDEVAIMYMLERLRAEARDAGGELIVMNGNHETLNAAGRFRYAKPAGAEDFRRWRGRQLFGAALKAKCGERPGQCTLLGAESAAAAGTRASRVPDASTTARRLRHRRRRIGRARTPTVAPTGIIPRANPRGVVGGIVDAASGGTRAGGPMATRSLAISRWWSPRDRRCSRTGRARAPRGVRTRPREPRDERLDLRQKGGRAAVHVTGGDSVVWARHYSHPEEYRCDCVALENALAAVGGGARRVVVGHTIQGDAGVNAACDGRVIRVDVGMSAGVAGTSPKFWKFSRMAPEESRDSVGTPARRRWSANPSQGRTGHREGDVKPKPSRENSAARRMTAGEAKANRSPRVVYSTKVRAIDVFVSRSAALLAHASSSSSSATHDSNIASSSASLSPCFSTSLA